MEAQKIDVETLYDAWVENRYVKLEKKDFFKNVNKYLASQEKEICGKCVPCRDGIPRIKEIFLSLSKGDISDEEVLELDTLVKNLRSSRCSIGITVGRNLEVILQNNFNLLTQDSSKGGKK